MEANKYVVQRIAKGFLVHMFLIIFAVTCLFPAFLDVTLRADDQ